MPRQPLQRSISAQSLARIIYSISWSVSCAHVYGMVSCPTQPPCQYSSTRVNLALIPRVMCQSNQKKISHGQIDQRKLYHRSGRAASQGSARLRRIKIPVSTHFRLLPAKLHNTLFVWHGSEITKPCWTLKMYVSPAKPAVAQRFGMIQPHLFSPTQHNTIQLSSAQPITALHTTIKCPKLCS